jgi:hypothetical protein
MNQCLIDYDRRAGKLRALKAFPDHQRREAQNESLDIELSARDEVLSGKREIVLLEADDIGILHRTHQRYFKAPKDIMESMLDEEPQAADLRAR